jgi:riboflavin synthase
MFTGIIETLGQVVRIDSEGSNKTFKIKSSLRPELKVDQSVAHNGVCLTVTHFFTDYYFVTAIEETLSKTNLGKLKPGDSVNLERCLQFNGRIDGHLVQGHVDQTGKCVSIEKKEGSWVFTFSYDAASGNVTVEKGSVCVNGVSLTVINSEKGHFSVAIIPYTFEHTTFKSIKKGDLVNIEFDILGKYIARLNQK